MYQEIKQIKHKQLWFNYGLIILTEISFFI